MANNKIRLKCILGQEIRVVSAKKDVTSEDLIRILEQEFGRPITVKFYEDHERDVVIIGSDGLQTVLTEHAELYSATGPLPTLKLFLESSSPEEPNNHPPTSKSGSSLNLSKLSTGSNGSQPSPRNVLGNEHLNGLNGLNGVKRHSSKYSINSNPNSNNENTTTSSTSSRHSGKVELEMSHIGTPTLDAENAPPYRTPPRTPPDHYNPLRTPPGSPKRARSPQDLFRTPPDSPKAAKKEHKENGTTFPHNLRIDTESSRLENSRANSISPRNCSSPRNHSTSPRNHNVLAHTPQQHDNSRFPHYLLHPEPESVEHAPNGGSTPRNDTPPMRTPPQSPQYATRDSPPLTPSALPPSPWIPNHDSRASPAPLHRNLAQDARNNNNNNNLPPTLNLEGPVFPVPQSPQNPPVPLFVQPKSPRIASPKFPSSIIEQNKDDHIKWDKGPVVGRGAFGCVYMGMRDNGELIAVKQLEIDETEDPKSRVMISSFAQEINVMKGLRHDNIVRYLGVQVEERYLNIFLEFVAGGSISTLLGKFKRFSEPVIRVYTKQILQGIAYLHDHRIVHRDIKGANILVDVDGTVKLADFGCSKIFGGLKSQLKTVLGTPYWMAPEVIKQSGYGRSADVSLAAIRKTNLFDKAKIWSLGCVIIEMATGQPPWQAQFSEVTAAMFHIASTESLPEIPSHLSPEALDFLSLCFKRAPKERPNAKKLLMHPFVQDAPLTRRNSINGPTTPTSPPPGGLVPPIPWQRKLNRVPSTSSPTVPTTPFTLTDAINPATSDKYHKFDMLPTKIVIHIFSFLSLDQQTKMRYICKFFAQTVKEDVWRLGLKRSRSTTTGSAPSTDNNRRIWADEKIMCTTLKGHDKPIHCLFWTEIFLATGGEDKKIRLWDVKKGKLLVSLKGHGSTVTGVCVDKSSNIYSASADMCVRIWGFKNGSQTKKTSVSTLSGHTSPLTSVILADGETKIVSASYDTSLRVWESAGKNAHLATLTGHDGAVNCVQSVGGMVVASASSDGTLKIWDLRVPSSAVRTLTGHIGDVRCCHFGNDRLVSGGEDKSLRIWDIGTGRMCKRHDHTCSITAVTTDSSKIVSAGDKVVKLWEWDGETSTRTLNLPGVFALAIDDHNKLFTAGHDKAIRIYTPENPAATPRSLFARLRALEL